MPPYTPLATPALKMPDWFFNPQFTELNQAIGENEKLRAQELVNQANDLQVQQATRKNDSDEAIRNILKQYGSEADPNEPMDVRKISDLVGKAALGAGDYTTAISAAKAGRETAQTRLLTPEERAIFGATLGQELPEGSTMGYAQGLTSALKAKTYNDSMSDPNFLKNRELAAKLKQQDLEGTQVRPMTPQQVESQGAAQSFSSLVDDTIATYADSVPDNIGERFIRGLNPNEPTARFVKELAYVAKRAALAMENRVTDQDAALVAAIVSPGPLETKTTLIDKVNRLNSSVRRDSQIKLGAMKQGGFNVSGFENPQPTPSQIPTANASQESERQAYKEQYKAKLRAQRGL